MPEEGAPSILTKIVCTEAVRELTDIFGTDEGTALGILVDCINQDPFLNNRETAEHVLTSRSMCAIVPVPDGCSWYPKSIAKIEIALSGALRLTYKSFVHSMQKIKK